MNLYVSCELQTLNTYADRITYDRRMAKLAYTLEEAAEQTGYSVRTLKNHAADGRLIIRYANTKGVVRHQDLEAWLESLPTEPPAR